MKIFLSILFIVSALSVTSSAQSFVMQAPTVNKNYNVGAKPPFTFGSNQFMALYPTGSYFNASATGACGAAFPYCNGLGVFVSRPGSLGGGQITYGEYAKLLYVSPTQINLVLPKLDVVGITTSFNDYCISVNYADASTERAMLNVYLDANGIQPVTVEQNVGGVMRKMLVGGLYGWNASHTAVEFIKSLTDGTANPRTYNDYPTIVQASFTGSASTGLFLINELPVPPIGYATTYFSGYDGIYVANLDTEYATSGINAVEMWIGAQHAYETTISYIDFQ